MTQKTKNKQYSFRLDDETIKQLDELCNLYTRNRTQVIETLIMGEYYKTTEIGKKKIAKLMNELNNVATHLDEIAQQ